MNNVERLKIYHNWMKELKKCSTQDLINKKIKPLPMEVMLSCPVCGEPYIKENKYEWKPNCKHLKNIVICML